MRFLKHKPFNLILVLAIFALLALSSFSLLSLAQEPTPFEISVIPQAEYAVAGQPFSYTVVVTYVGQDSLKDVFVRAKTPENTTFAGTGYGKVNWWVRKPNIGEFGEIFWVTLDPVAPGEVISFSLIVDVPYEAEQSLINKDYNIAVGDVDNFIASGPPITTQIATPTPFPTPTTMSSPTPDIIPTQSPVTSSVSPVDDANNSLPSPTIAPTTAVVEATASAGDTIQGISSTNTSMTLLTTIGLITALIIGLAWFFKRK